MHYQSTARSLSGSDTHETTSLLNRDLARISIWAKKFKVTFNSDKTKEIIFSKQVMNNSLPLIFDGHIADRCGKHKHLGVTLTPDLSWDIHINNIIKQVNLKLSMIYSVRQLSRQTLDIIGVVLTTAYKCLATLSMKHKLQNLINYNTELPK